MKICRNCDIEYRDIAEFCPECGEQLEEIPKEDEGTAKTKLKSNKKVAGIIVVVIIILLGATIFLSQKETVELTLDNYDQYLESSVTITDYVPGKPITFNLWLNNHSSSTANAEVICKPKGNYTFEDVSITFITGKYDWLAIIEVELDKNGEGESKEKIVSASHQLSPPLEPSPDDIYPSVISGTVTYNKFFDNINKEEL